ncbi:MAG: 3-methyl-2-oxobutanoate dehydrogenase subunit beta, partial [Oscillospiraceae bacterium]
KSAVNSAREKGIKVGAFRPITLWPFPEKEIKSLCKTAKHFLTVEMSMGQMVEDVRLSVNGEREVSFFGRTGGIIPTPAEVLEQIEKIAGGLK